MAKRKSSPRKPAQAKEAQASNPFDFQAPEVDEALYGEQRVTYPAAIWMSRYDGDDEQSRPWVIDRENVSVMPQPYWREEQVRFGDSPNEPFTPVYMTEVLRGVPLGVRKRQIVSGDDGNTYHYHIFTKRTERQPGKLTFHYQVMMSLTGLPYDELVVLGLRGYTRTMSWQHDGKRNSDFPVGVENKLQEYAGEASKAVGGQMPIWCTWMVDLRGVHYQGAPYYVSVGPNEETWVQPFGVDLRTSSEPRDGSAYDEDGSIKIDKHGLPFTRYVGNEMFGKYQQLYKDTVADWIAEWSQANMASGPVTSGDGNHDDEYGDVPVGTEEDEIPF